MKTKKIKVRQGFTIVELVIVIGVIGVLTAVLVPTFINLSKKAEAASQQSFLKNINTQLAMRQAEGAKLETMYDAIEVADAMGFDVEKISPIEGNDIVYDNVAKRFALMKGNEVTYSDGGIKGAGIEIWKIADSAQKAAALNTAGNSIYAKSSWNIGNLAEIKVGFDAGKNMTANSVSYVDSTTQAAIIRTNTGAIEINAPQGKVRHFGKADSVNIKAIAPTSYHEKGQVGFANIKTGRLVIEEEAKIEGVYLEETSGSFNDIKIALVGKAELPSVARSDVSMNNGDKKLVVELQTLATPEAAASKQEYVWISKDADVVSSAVSSSATDASAVVENPTAAAAAVKEETKQAAAPVTDNSVARVGAIGFESFNAAVNAAKPGDKIYLLKDFTLSNSIGDYADDSGPNQGLYEGSLANEVVLANDVKISLANYTEINLTIGGKISLNGHKLSIDAASSNSGVYYCQKLFDNEEDYNNKGFVYDGSLVTVTEDLEYTAEEGYPGVWFDLVYNGTKWQWQQHLLIGGSPYDIKTSKTGQAIRVVENDITVEYNNTVDLDMGDASWDHYNWNCTGTSDVALQTTPTTNGKATVKNKYSFGMSDIQRIIYCDASNDDGTWQRYYWVINLPGLDIDF